MLGYTWFGRYRMDWIIILSIYAIFALEVTRFHFSVIIEVFFIIWWVANHYLAKFVFFNSGFAISLFRIFILKSLISFLFLDWVLGCSQKMEILAIEWWFRKFYGDQHCFAKSLIYLRFFTHIVIRRRQPFNVQIIS